MREHKIDLKKLGFSWYYGTTHGISSILKKLIVKTQVHITQQKLNAKLNYLKEENIP